MSEKTFFQVRSQLDELTGKTVRSYINKAEKEVSDHTRGKNNATTDAAHDYHKGRIQKRKKGLEKAYNKALGINNLRGK